MGWTLEKWKLEHANQKLWQIGNFQQRQIFPNEKEHHKFHKVLTLMSTEKKQKALSIRMAAKETGPIQALLTERLIKVRSHFYTRTMPPVYTWRIHLEAGHLQNRKTWAKDYSKLSKSWRNFCLCGATVATSVLFSCRSSNFWTWISCLKASEHRGRGAGALRTVPHNQVPHIMIPNTQRSIFNMKLSILYLISVPVRDPESKKFEGFVDILVCACPAYNCQIDFSR